MLASTTINILKFHGCYRLQPLNTHISRNIHPISSTTYCKSDLSSASILSSSPSSRSGRKFRNVKVAEMGAPLWTQKDDENMRLSTEDLTVDGDVYQKTLRLVECSMFAALGGLVYILSSSLAIENYFGCFFALPIVFSSMRWDVVAGRKTMVATATLLLVLAGPIKAITYLLMHGFLGLAMGSLWRSKTSWGVSILVSAVVRAVGAVGYVLMYSFLIRENILALITINIHASATFILSSLGFLAIPSMNVIYTIFGTLLLLNCCFFVFLLHLLYALFFARLGMKASLRLPNWLYIVLVYMFYLERVIELQHFGDASITLLCHDTQNFEDGKNIEVQAPGTVQLGFKVVAVWRVDTYKQEPLIRKARKERILLGEQRTSCWLSNFNWCFILRHFRVT